MTQSQIDRLGVIKQNAAENLKELTAIWHEIESQSVPTYSDEGVKDLSLIGSLQIPAFDLVNKLKKMGI